MPHADDAHALKIQLATALRETERLQEALGDAFKELREVQSDLTAEQKDLADARRMIFMLVTQMGGEVVIGRSVILRLDDARATIETSRDPGGDLRIRAALAGGGDRG